MTERERAERAKRYRREQARKRKRKRRREKLTLFGVLCFFVVLLCSNASIAASSLPLIRLRVKKAEMIQDEQVPEFEVEVILNHKESGERVLDPASKYTVKDLVKELKKKKHFSVSCEADGKTDETYPIKLKLDKELEKKIRKKWHNRVMLVTEDAELVVKNKLGTWKGKQFEKYDGTLAKNEFIISKNHTYYFDEIGNMVTGTQTIDGSGYWFNDSGIMQTGWRDADGVKYYYAEDGKMAIGWLKLDDDKYYFDSDGRMLTGEHQIGMQKCDFSKDGKLQSIKESSIDKNKPMMALTFDDGPGPRTMELLSVLEKYGAHATFFMQGIHAAKYQDEIKKMTEIGCELGNHSYNHANLSKQDAKGLKDQVDKTNDLIKGIVGRGATVLRPPYGAIGGVMHEKVKMPMILWNIDTLDWKTRNAQKTIETVMNNVGDGDIVLMHDIHTESVDAALKLIPKLEKEGYQLVTISEMAEAKGQKLENGVKYCDFTAKTLSKAKENQESEE